MIIDGTFNEEKKKFQTRYFDMIKGKERSELFN